MIGRWLAALAAPALAMGLPAQTAHYAGASFTITDTFTAPTGIAVDASGNVFVADGQLGTISEIVAVNGQVSSNSTVVQIASGFSSPIGLALDAAGDLFVADTDDGAVKEIVAVGGTVSPSSSIITVGGPSDPTFYFPTAVAVDASGNVFVTDAGYGTLMKIVATGGVISPSSMVVTLANGLGLPYGVAVDGSGNLFVSDAGFETISKYATTGGVVLPGTSPSTIVSGLQQPIGFGIDAAGDLFVASYNDGTVKEILAGTSTVVTLVSGADTPYGLGVSPTGTVYYTDISDGTANEIQTGVLNLGNVELDSLSPPVAVPFTFDSDGTLDSWSVLTLGATGKEFFEITTQTTCVAGQTYHAGDTCSVEVQYFPLYAGMRTGAVQLVSGGNVIATAHLLAVSTGPNLIYPVQTPYLLSNVFSSAAGLALDGNGDVFVGDMGAADVKEMVAVGGVVPANPTIIPIADFSFIGPSGVAVDGSGDLFVADESTGAVKEILAVNGQIPATPTIVTISSAFFTPEGIAIDGFGNIFVADVGQSQIFEIVAVNGQVSPTSQVIAVGGSGFSQPYGVAVDAAGDVFVADSANSVVREIVAVNGQVSASSQVVTNSNTLFSFPSGVAVDAAGNVFVADQNMGYVYEIGAQAGQAFSSWPVSTVTGPPYFAIPFQVIVDPAGDLLVADRTNGVLEVPFSLPPTLTFPTVTPVGTTDTTDGPMSFTIANDGNLPLVFQIPSTGKNPSIPADFGWDASSTCTQVSAGAGTAPMLAINGSCSIGIDFAPTDVGSISANATISYLPPDPGLGFATTSSVGLAGTSTTTTFTKLVVSAPTAVVQGQAFNFTVTAQDSLGNTITGYSGTVSFTSSDGSAVLPGASTLTAGVGTFSATLNTSGSQTLTASDTGAGVSGQATITVAAPQYLVVNVTSDDSGTAANCSLQATPGKNLTDTTPGCSLRDALLQAATLSQASISFDATTFATAQTITLTNGTTLNVPTNTTINGATTGSGATLTNLVTVDGGSGAVAQFPAFTVGSGVVATITDLTIQNASNAALSGGGIFNAGTLTVNNSSFISNSASVGGGIGNEGTLVISGSTFSGNNATGSPGGGALYNDAGATLVVGTSTMVGNGALGSGGGIYNGGGTATITDSTISGNNGGDAGTGGGIFNGATVSLNNSIVAGNIASSSSDLDGAFAATSAHNLIGDGTGESGISNGTNSNQVGTSASLISANLGAIGSYGGPTQTLMPLPGSPALCGGSSALFPAGVTTDQRGFPNTKDYPGATGCVDIGAVQTNYALTFTTEPPASISALPITPAPVVTLQESGNTASGASTGNVTLTDADAALLGTPVTVVLAAGQATFSTLSLSGTVSNDTFSASYPLMGSITLSATSTDFSMSNPALGVSISHNPAGGFVQGTTGEWDIVVSNTGTLNTTSTVTLTDVLPSGASPAYSYAMSSYVSAAFTCTGTTTVTCTSTSAIAGNGSASITLFVTVPGNSPTPVSNTVGVFGGGDTTHVDAGTAATATDSVPVSVAAVTLSAVGTTTLKAAANTAFASGSLAVVAMDGSSTPIANYPITFTAGTSAEGATGIFAATGTNTTTVNTNASGIADPGTFTANTKTGDYTVTATDGVLSVSFSMTNLPGTSIQLVITDPNTSDGTWPTQFTGWPAPIEVTALDQFGNTATTFPTTSHLHFTSTDGSATLPDDVDATLVNGVGTFSATFNATGTYTVTATDLADGTITGTSGGIVVNATPSYVVNTNQDDSPATAANCQAGSANPCSLRDAVAAAALSYAGNITFDSTVFNSTKTAADNTITLLHGVMDIANDTSITGPFTGTPLVTVDGNAAGGIFELIDPNEQAVISGLTITNGKLSSADADAVLTGAGINNDGTLTVTNSVISNNQVIASDATGAAGGGGIYTDGELIISSSTITGNSATAGQTGAGGGILNSQGYLEATDVTVTNNTVTVTANGGDAAGGGIFTDESEISHSAVVNNSAVAPNDGTSTAEGGGIAIDYRTCVQYTTIAKNNTAAGVNGLGGGIFNHRSNCLYNVTISNNTADGAGGYFLQAPGSLDEYNSIISGNALNAGGTGDADFVNSGTATVTDHGGNVVSTSGISLAPLGNYGGPTQTMVPLPGSPAICNGLLANITGLDTTTDQRGNANENTTYPGFDSGTPCIDSGAVQTAYQLAFTTAPRSYVITGTAIAPAPVVGLTESSNPATAATNTITMTDSDTALSAGGTNQTNLTGGSATFSNLILGSSVSGDTLTATLALTATVNLTTTAQVTSSNPVLGLAKTANGAFVQGQVAEWDIAVSDTAASSGTLGQITVQDALPSGYTLNSYNSDGGVFACIGSTTVTCTTSTAVVNGTPLNIQLKVNVPANSPTSVSNTAVAWGGGDATHVDLASGVASTSTVTVTQVPATVTINGLQTQSANVATAYGSLAVTVADAGGVGIFGTPVIFTASTGGTGASGIFSNNTNTTTMLANSSGVADPGTFTANSSSGAFTVSVSAGSATTSFSMTNLAVTPVITWTPASTIIYGNAGAGVLNATVNCTSCGSIVYQATPSGGSPSVIATTTGLTAGSYTITANFEPSGNGYHEATASNPLTVSGQSVWIVNGGGGTSELAGNGVAITSSAYGGANAAVAIDANGNVWTVGTGGTLLEATSQTGIAQYSLASGGGLNSPSAMAIDGNGQVWVTNTGNNSVSLFLNNGTASSPTTGFTDSSLSNPSGVAIDVGGSVWIANQGNNSVTRVLGAAAPVAPLSTAAANKTTGARP